MTPRVKVWLQWLTGIYQASVHRRGSRVRRLLWIVLAIKPPFDLQLRMWRERS